MRPFAIAFLLLAVLSGASFLLGASNLDELRTKAENGDAAAQFQLGRMFDTGDGVPRDATEAVRLYRLAAEQGNDASQWFLAIAYDRGRGVPRDAADAALAAKRYRLAADQGNANAQNSLGVMYDHGWGVPKDITEAAKWYRKAAEQGDSSGQVNLANMYANGDGVPKNSVEAVKWYRKAAYQGFCAAQNSLGWMYENGEGVPKDEIEALAWMNIAAASGWDDAVKSRNALEGVLGRQMSLVAQQRSKEILKEIEAAKPMPQAKDPYGDIAIAIKSSGSGAIVSSQGLILTAAHVVTGAAAFEVITAQGKYAAKVLRIDEPNDVALLKIEGGPYPALPIAPSRTVRLGQSVATIGFPNTSFQGFSPKVTRGEISSVNGYADDPRSWQISVPVQTGNSGGPLLDENGNLIGIVVSKLGLKATQATGDIPQNVNYAVKSAYALALLEPYLDKNAPEPRQGAKSFEDMVAQAQLSVVLVLAY